MLSMLHLFLSARRLLVTEKCIKLEGRFYSQIRRNTNLELVLWLFLYGKEGVLLRYCNLYNTNCIWFFGS